MNVFWDISPNSLVETDGRFRTETYLYCPGDEGSTLLRNVNQFPSDKNGSTSKRRSMYTCSLLLERDISTNDIIPSQFNPKYPVRLIQDCREAACSDKSLFHLQVECRVSHFHGNGAFQFGDVSELVARRSGRCRQNPVFSKNANTATEENQARLPEEL